MEYKIYGEPSIYNIFNAISFGRNRKSVIDGYLYTVLTPTYREDGSIRKSKDWQRTVYFHEKYARKGDKISKVTFDVIISGTDNSIGYLIINNVVFYSENNRLFTF